MSPVLLRHLTFAGLVVVFLLARPAPAAAQSNADLGTEERDRRCAATSLCARLGGPDGLVEISSALLELSLADPRTAPQWDRVDMKRVRIKLSEYLCVLTGGTCPYDDDDLKAIHAGHHIQQAQFYAMVEHLRLVLDRRGTDTASKNELLRLLAPSRRDVVEP